MSPSSRFVSLRAALLAGAAFLILASTPGPALAQLCPPAPPSDVDGDSVDDAVDNCPTIPNTDQADGDGDGRGDACESGTARADIDNSGRVDGFDLAALARNFLTNDAQADQDGNGVVDEMDLAIFANDFGGTVDLLSQVFPAPCRELFFDRDLVTADACFRRELLINPDNAEANLFRALTRLLLLIGKRGPGPDADRFTDSLDEMLARFGAVIQNGSFFDLDVVFPDMLPTDAPTGGDVQEFLSTGLLEQLEAAADENLDSIPPDFCLEVLPDEIVALIDPNNPFLDPNAVEMDLGDTKTLEAFLEALRGVLLTFVIAHDLDIDIDATERADYTLQQFLNANPDFWNLTTEGAARLADAKAALQAAVDDYLIASDFIRNLDDVNQADDLVTIEPVDLLDEELLRLGLGQIYCSLNGVPFLAFSGVGVLCAPAGDPMIGDDVINLSGFYDTPFDLRDMLPSFAFDAACGQEYVDTGLPAPFPDPTFGGVFPNQTQADLRAGLGPDLGVAPRPVLDLVATPGFSSFGYLFVANDGGDLTAPVVIGGGGLRTGTVFRISLVCSDICEPFDQVTFPATLCQGEGALVEIEFMPTTQGCFTDTFFVESNDFDEPLIEVQLRGSADSPCP